MEIREEIEYRFGWHLARVGNLVALYQWHAVGAHDDRPEQLPDLLRAAVVFLHASLEDLLRSLAEWKLPTAPAGSLDRILLANSGKPKDRFVLSDLAEFRGQTVDAVIAKSVEAHLERSSYNHPGEIDELLARIGVVYRIEKPLRDTLAAMMSRRHAIAHRADRDASEVVRRHELPRGRAIDPALVLKWTKAVEEFGKGVLKQV